MWPGSCEYQNQTGQALESIPPGSLVATPGLLDSCSDGNLTVPRQL